MTETPRSVQSAGSKSKHSTRDEDEGDSRDATSTPTFVPFEGFDPTDVPIEDVSVVVVSNLDRDCTEAIIAELFNNAGPVIHVDMEDLGRDGRVALVYYPAPDSAEYSVKLLDGIKLYNQRIVVEVLKLKLEEPEVAQGQAYPNNHQQQLQFIQMQHQQQQAMYGAPPGQFNQMTPRGPGPVLGPGQASLMGAPPRVVTPPYLMNQQAVAAVAMMQFQQLQQQHQLQRNNFSPQGQGHGQVGQPMHYQQHGQHQHHHQQQQQGYGGSYQSQNQRRRR